MKILYQLNEEIKKRGVRNVAKKAGISENTLNNWLYGKSVPTISRAQKVANAMGLELFLFSKYEG